MLSLVLHQPLWIRRAAGWGEKVAKLYRQPGNHAEAARAVELQGVRT